jgi:hypothetical protein
MKIKQNYIYQKRLFLKKLLKQVSFRIMGTTFIPILC